MRPISESVGAVSFFMHATDSVGPTVTEGFDAADLKDAKALLDELY